MLPVTLANAPIELEARVAGHLVVLPLATHEERVAAIFQVRESTVSRTFVISCKVDHQRT